MRLNILLCILLIIPASNLLAQDNTLSNKYIRPTAPIGTPYNSNYLVNEGRVPLYLPEIEGYVLLKCDLHMHTVFSDGYVWPVTRVEEAFRDGLDAISITEHFEFRHINRKDVDTDNLMREYEIAKPSADELGILLIPGLEITREVPTGHFNMLFIENPSPLLQYVDKDNPRDPSRINEILAKGKELGAFTFWNHPAYQKPNGAEWDSIHQSLFKKGLFQGVEIINSNLYVPMVHHWADTYGLTKMANTDWHHTIRTKEGWHRGMTIVFAKERSVKALKEALFQRQTVCFAGNYLYGEQKYLEPIFHNSIKTRTLSETDEKVVIEIRNTSGIPFEMIIQEDEDFKPSVINAKGVVVYANESVGISIDKKTASKRNKIYLTINNLHIKANEPMRTELTFK